MPAVRINSQIDEFPKATIAIIIVNILLFLVLLFVPEIIQKTILGIFSYGPQNYYIPFAPLSSSFMHASFLSLLFSTVFLLIFGPEAETRAGTFRFVLLYLLAGLTGAVLEMGIRMLTHGIDVPNAGGASGAVSGLVALLVYRLWYSRKPMLLDPVLLKLGFALPLFPFILLWFMKDLIIGTQSMGTLIVSSGHMAQVGGFLTGLLLARIYGLGHEENLDVLRSRIMRKYNNGGKWETANRALKKLRDMSPGDGGVNLDLARIYAGQYKKKEASLYFRKAVDGYHSSDPIEAAKITMEHFKTVKLPMSIQIHHKIARSLVDKGMKKQARILMISALRHKADNTLPYEEAIVFYVLLLLDLGEKQEAKRAYGIFKKRFPDSPNHAKIMASVKKAPGTIFELKETVSDDETQEDIQRDITKDKVARALEVATHPLLVPIWFLVFLLCALLDMLGVLPGNAVSGLSGLGWQMLILLLSILITAEIQLSLSRLIMALIKEQIKKAKEKKRQKQLDAGAAAESKEETADEETPDEVATETEPSEEEN
ncbi:rhomboid family intramembrane serine protease [Nitrospirota bacterium]